MDRRPGSVTFVAIMMFVAAVAYAFGAVWNFVLWLAPEEQQLFYGRAISDWYWVVNGSLSLLLAVLFVWVARMAMRGDYAAGMTITMLAILNIVFSLFNIFHGYGWVTLAVSVLILVANQSAASQSWYAQSLSRPVR